MAYRPINRIPSLCNFRNLFVFTQFLGVLFSKMIYIVIAAILVFILALNLKSESQPKPRYSQSKKKIHTCPEIIKGKCHIIDGDTIAIGKQKIRLAGIDAPELHNPYGKQAKWAMIKLCKGQNITAHLTGETSYDRVVARCFLDDGRDLAAEMVKQELALDIPHFPNADYKHLETPNVRRKLRWRPKSKD